MTKIKWASDGQWEDGTAFVGGTIAQTRQKHTPPVGLQVASLNNGKPVVESYVIVAEDRIEFTK